MRKELTMRINPGYTPTDRYPSRIEPFLAELRLAWLSAPNQRLGQLMDNLGISGFYIEDDKALEILKRYNESGHQLITKD